jgi:hypothetical protein
MAWAIGQEIAQELPIKGGSGQKKKTGYVPKDRVSGQWLLASSPCPRRSTSS